MCTKFAYSLILLIAIQFWTPTHTIPLNQDTVVGEYNGNLDDQTIEKIKKCESSLQLMELCMRCAKITKSTYVYPMCCDNEEQVTDWCHDYVYFGINNKPAKP